MPIRAAHNHTKVVDLPLVEVSFKIRFVVEMGYTGLNRY